MNDTHQKQHAATTHDDPISLIGRFSKANRLLDNATSSLNSGESALFRYVRRLSGSYLLSCSTCPNNV